MRPLPFKFTDVVIIFRLVNLFEVKAVPAVLGKTFWLAFIVIMNNIFN